MKKQCWHVGRSLGSPREDRFCRVKLRLTQRAPDWWESARFRAVCVALSWFHYNGVVASRPPAGNAHRWALRKIEDVLIYGKGR
jgi:hypothetical protein